MKRRATRGMGSVYQRGGTWWIAYYVPGEDGIPVQRRESSGSKKQDDGVALLKRRHEELGKGRSIRDAEKVLLTSLRSLIDGDYRAMDRRSGKRLSQAWAHLVSYFGATAKAISITAPRLEDYLTSRLNEGAERGTAKNELNALRHAFKLAQRSGTLLANEVPIFPTIKTSAPRQGFFEREEHDMVRAALPPDEGDLVEYLYWTGWRTSEAKGLRWSNVDEAAGIIRIETSKNEAPRTLPYSVLPELADLIAHRRAVTDAVQKKRGIIVPWVFHRNGKPILHFRRSWTTACIAAGLGQEFRGPDVLDAAGKVVKRGKLLSKVATRIPHDYRRSAARNLSRAGVPEGVIMKICGWKTRTVFDRYNIAIERDLAEGLAKLAGVPQAAKRAKVTRIAKAK